MANNSQPAFLVFPTGTPVYAWKVVATESNRTISRHKILMMAVYRAMALNRRAEEANQ